MTLVNRFMLGRCPGVGGEGGGRLYTARLLRFYSRQTAFFVTLNRMLNICWVLQRRVGAAGVPHDVLKGGTGSTRDSIARFSFSFVD